MMHASFWPPPAPRVSMSAAVCPSTPPAAAPVCSPPASYIVQGRDRGIRSRPSTANLPFACTPAADKTPTAAIKVIDFGTSDFCLPGHRLAQKFGTPYYVRAGACCMYFSCTSLRITGTKPLPVVYYLSVCLLRFAHTYLLVLLLSLAGCPPVTH